MRHQDWFREDWARVSHPDLTEQNMELLNIFEQGSGMKKGSFKQHLREFKLATVKKINLLVNEQNGAEIFVLEALALIIKFYAETVVISSLLEIGDAPVL